MRRGSLLHLRPIDVYCSLTHYADHLAPVWLALPPERRGTFHAEPRAVSALRSYGITARQGRPGKARRLVIVAGAHDIWRVRSHPAVLVEHGAGQSYGDHDDPGWSGGMKRDGAVLFLCPNEPSAARNRGPYPDTPSLVVGSPRVEHLRSIPREASVRPVVALSWHHPGTGTIPEAGWALPHYEPGLGEVVDKLRAQGYEVIGHGHPRARHHFSRLWRRLGVEHVERFDDVVRRASVYACDNSSTMFEAAACGIRIVVMDAPWYRREVDWWPRFWRCADVGVQVGGPDALADGILAALDDPPPVRAARERVVREVYPLVEGSALRSADAVLAAAQDER